MCWACKPSYALLSYYRGGLYQALGVWSEPNRVNFSMHTQWVLYRRMLCRGLLLHLVGFVWSFCAGSWEVTLLQQGCLGPLWLLVPFDVACMQGALGAGALWCLLLACIAGCRGTQAGSMDNLISPNAARHLQ